ncbi:MAG: nuclear transport factor 2 family protein [Pseudomonadota bacterium]
MHTEHPNIDIMNAINVFDSASRAQHFAPDVVWHFFNPLAPGLTGDFHGHSGLGVFFHHLRATSNDTFTIRPFGAYAIGDELVVAPRRNSVSTNEETTEFDVVTVWRFVDGQVVEVWDIPAVHTAWAGPRPQAQEPHAS